MGKGRKPVPTELKMLRGNPGKRAISKAEPMPEVLEASTAPSWLTEDQVEIWEELYPILKRMRVLTEADSMALCNLCIALSEVKAANQTIREEGRVIISPLSGVQTAHPAVSNLHKAMSAANKLFAEFGLTPATRTKIRSSDIEGKEQSPLVAFLGGKTG